jgi:hypothetical protein
MVLDLILPNLTTIVTVLKQWVQIQCGGIVVSYIIIAPMASQIIPVCVCYASIKIFNKLPVHIAQLVMDKKRFISVLKRFLITEAFYSINEFFDYQDEMIIEH